MTHVSPPIGNEISCIMHGVKEEFFNDNFLLRTIFLKALSKDKFNILDISEKAFDPKGYTIMALLSESHATIHTFPEHSSMVFHIYTCRGENDGRKTFAFLKQSLKPEDMDFFERPVVVNKEVKDELKK